MYVQYFRYSRRSSATMRHPRMVGPRMVHVGLSCTYSGTLQGVLFAWVFQTPTAGRSRVSGLRGSRNHVNSETLTGGHL